MSKETKTESTAVSVRDPQNPAWVQLDDAARKMGLIVAGSDNPFTNALRVANGAAVIRRALTPEIMAPIMELQNSTLGFLTDKPGDEHSAGGYPPEIVKDCVIHAMRDGLSIVGNQFNILAGRYYVTKAGLAEMLNRTGVPYQITPGVPQILRETEWKTNAQTGKRVCAKGEAIAPVEIRWNQSGEWETANMKFSVAVNVGMGADAITGKAVRKARAWLLERIRCEEVPTGEVEDAGAPVVDVTPEPAKPSIFSQEATRKAFAAAEPAKTTPPPAERAEGALPGAESLI